MSEYEGMQHFFAAALNVVAFVLLVFKDEVVHFILFSQLKVS